MQTCKHCVVVPLLWIVVVVVKSNPTNSNIHFRALIPSITKDPTCAINATFCEDIESYPYSHLKHILDNDYTYKGIFSDGDIKEELVNRHSSDGTFICRSISRTVFPKIGKNKNNKWKFIINQDKYLQGVRVETCYKPGSSCDVLGQIPASYTILCKQKYVYSKLLSLSDGGYPTPDIFKLPSACCCAYKRNIHFFQQFTPISSVKFVPQTNP